MNNSRTGPSSRGGGGRIAILGVPSDANSSCVRGPAEAPPRIREALFSDAANMWTETGVDLGADDTFLDVGDLDGIDAQPDAWDRVERAVASLLDEGRCPIVLGGDHSITFPILKAFRRNHPRLSILHFDAHPDLYHDFRGNPFSHASPFARIMEAGLADRLVQVGIRTATGHQREQAERFGVETIEMRRLDSGVPLGFEGPVFVSVDMDGFDPAYAPGVSHPEPGGLTPRQVFEMIQALRGSIVGADIVELNPGRDVQDLTATLAAKVLKELAGRVLGG